MFKIAAILYAMTNGIQADQPFDTVFNKREFPTKEACTQYLESDRGVETRQYIEAWAANLEVKIAVKFDCIEANNGEKL